MVEEAHETFRVWITIELFPDDHYNVDAHVDEKLLKEHSKLAVSALEALAKQIEEKEMPK